MKNDSDIWARGLIGKPWVSGGRGPDAFDCWGLVRWVYLQQLAIILPDFPGLDAKNLHHVSTAYSLEVSDWREILTPSPFCVVGMSKRNVIHHVGLALSDGRTILHCMDGSAVIAQTVYSLRASGFSTIKFFEYK
jgi:cell wall-associated NlpC family hydrolase